MPCVDVTFITSVDKFYSEETTQGCPNNGGKIMMQFSKTFEYEVVSFIFKIDEILILIIIEMMFFSVSRRILSSKELI